MLTLSSPVYWSSIVRPDKSFASLPSSISILIGLLLSLALGLSMAPAYGDDDDDEQSLADTPIEDKWALVVGISKYQFPHINLRYAAKDATDFKDYLINEAHFAPDHVRLLTNENATRESIMSELGDSWLPRVARPKDLVVVFVSSHGSPSSMDQSGANYLITYNTDPQRLYATGLPMQDLSDAIRYRVHAKRILLILDACHSGAAKASKDLVRAHNFNADQIVQGTGQLVICSSKPDQISWESLRYPNGVFTSHLLKALRSNGDKTKLADAFTILQNGVEDEVLKDQSELQTPVIKMKWEGSALALGVVPTHPRPGILDGAKTSGAQTVGQAKVSMSKSAEMKPAESAKPDPDLELRRLINDLKEQKLPNQIVQLEALLGYKVAWEVDWNSFGTNAEALDNLEYQGFGRVVDAVRIISADSIGKQALKGAVKKLIFRNILSNADKQIMFKDGVLKVFAAWGAGEYPQVQEIKGALENGLP